MQEFTIRIQSIGWEVFGETLSWWTPTRTTTNWPLTILGLPPLFLEMSVYQLLYRGIFILICPNMLRAMSVNSACVPTTPKIEAAAWLEGGSRVCDQCFGEDEHVQNEVHALSLCQDHCQGRPLPVGLRAEETLLLCLHLFLRTFQQPDPFCCNRSTTNLFIISFLSKTLLFFVSLRIYLWLAETSQQPISQTTWLKFTQHCNHCNHYSVATPFILAANSSKPKTDALCLRKLVSSCWCAGLRLPTT